MLKNGFTVRGLPGVDEETPFLPAGEFDGFPLYRMSGGSKVALYFSRQRQEGGKLVGGRWQLHRYFNEEDARESAAGRSHAISISTRGDGAAPPVPLGTTFWSCWIGGRWIDRKLTLDIQVTWEEALAAEQESSKQALAALEARLTEEHAIKVQAAVVAALTQGLAYPTSRRIDLSAVGLTQVTDGQLDTIARACPEDLEALFLPPGTKLTESRLGALRDKFPHARCLALGCEISAAGYSDLCAQYSRHDEQLSLLLTGEPQAAAEPSTPRRSGFGVAAQSPASGDAPNSPTVEDASAQSEEQQARLAMRAVSNNTIRCISCDEDKVPGCYSANQLRKESKSSRNKSIRCKECIANNRVRAQSRNNGGTSQTSARCRTLDLSGDLFTELTDAGLLELATLCPEATAIFLSGETNLTDAGLEAFRASCPRVRCLALGTEISRQSLIALLEQYNRTNRIDISPYAGITDRGLREIPGLCPNLEAVFSKGLPLSENTLEQLRDACKDARCVILGREISAAQYMLLEDDILRSQTIDLVNLAESMNCDKSPNQLNSDESFSWLFSLNDEPWMMDLSFAGLDEIGKIPGIEKAKACFVRGPVRAVDEFPAWIHHGVQQHEMHIVFVGEEDIEVQVRTEAVDADRMLQSEQAAIRKITPWLEKEPKKYEHYIPSRDIARTTFVEKAKAFAAAVAEDALLQRLSRLEFHASRGTQCQSKELGAWRRVQAQAQHMMELATEIKAVADADEPAASLAELKRLQKENKACRRKVGRARRDKANAQDDLDEANEAADTEAADEARAEVLKAELVSKNARRALHDNSRAMQRQVVQLVRLASRHFPELEANDDVQNFMGSGGLLGPEQRQLDDFDNVRPMATKGRNELKRAEFDGQEVCLKRFPLQDVMKNYLQEIRSVQKLKHPYIISYGAVFHDTGSMYVQMEFFAHGSLRQWVDTTNPSVLQKRTVLRQLLLAIACIHSQNIIHCDLKNENVLIADDGTPRLCDFEMSKDLDGSASTFFGGSPGFIAPEILSGTQKYSAASDMYAFGVLLLNTFRPPGRGEPYPNTDILTLQDGFCIDISEQDDFRVKVQPGVVAMLQQEPAQRPTAAQMLADYFERDADEAVCPDGWTTKDGFACIDLSAETLMIKLMDLSLRATAKELTTTSASDSMKKSRVQRVVRIENHLLFEDYQRERRKIARRLKSRSEEAAGFEMLSEHQPEWFSTDDLERFILNELSQTSGTGQNFQFPEDDSADINEFYLWHGLPATIVLEDGTTHETWRIIAEHGFDERIGGDTNGKLYGSGCYFADGSSKSNQYSKHTANEDGHHCMLRCRVVMGDPYMAQEPYKGRRPPLNEATPGLPYDSIFAEENVTVNGGRANGGYQFHNEYVIFNGAQVYPEYAVFYTL